MATTDKVIQPPTPALVAGPLPFDPNALAAAFNEALRQVQAKEQPAPAEAAKQLQERLEFLRQPETFQVGDLVTWKPGLKNKRFPYDNQPAIVVEVLAEPLVDHRESPVSQYFREPLTLILGVIADDGSFATFYYDKRRFTHFGNPTT